MIATLLKRHRIRRFNAARVRDVLRQPPLKVAATTESASAHVTTLIARVRLSTGGSNKRIIGSIA
ncbi:hypothetical protein [Sinorhizobium sp. BJ1]|uniref:hypothetical protein n=1 Tax=Sinorhizobium sp. BJ1 TaxID=2035455 RepID=UPI000BE9388F|nr:hypothetical protein [Sinorhizobium sp. BJ1]PDT81027.1 hypothetical protein CO676_24125 [Sinorhizobium sp. BJ1]